jgi:hypothetical protein
LALLRSAYAQNYLYLIKKPADQYQVILEVEDGGRSTADSLALLYIRSDDGKRLVPLKALISWKSSLGPQAVNHLNQFTSMTLFFNLKPGVAIGDANDFITKAAAEIVPPTLRASLQGEALTFRDTVRDLTLLMVLVVFVMYVILAILYESYLHPLTVLSTLPTALVGGLATLFVFGEQASLYAFIGIRRSRYVKRTASRSSISQCSVLRIRLAVTAPRCQHGSLSADSYDHSRGCVRSDSHRAWVRRGWRVAAAAWARHRRRFDRLAVHYAVYYASHLSLSRGVSRTGFGSPAVFSPRPYGRVAGSSRGCLAHGVFFNRPNLGSLPFTRRCELHCGFRLPAAKPATAARMARSLE